MGSKVARNLDVPPHVDDSTRVDRIPKQSAKGLGGEALAVAGLQPECGQLLKD